MPGMASSIMVELKSATREQHEAAESLVNFDAAIGDPLSYRRLLEEFYGFYAPVEQRLSGVAGLEKIVPDLRPG